MIIPKLSFLDFKNNLCRNIARCGLVFFVSSYSFNAYSTQDDRVYYQDGNLPPFSQDAVPEMGWDVYENPNDPLVQRLTPYYQNDTRDVQQWQVIIKAWEYDPPNGILLRVVDQRPLLVSESQIDVRLEAGYYDDTNNMIVESRAVFRDIYINPGENLIVLPFHNDRTHVIHARVTDVRNKTPIKPVD
ncbi:MAG: hypothetical protein ACPGMR_14280 [Pontibacterium sp.]